MSADWKPAHPDWTQWNPSFEDMGDAVSAQSITADQASGLLWLLRTALEDTEGSGTEPLGAGYEPTRDVGALLELVRQRVKGTAKGLEEAYALAVRQEQAREKTRQKGPNQ